MRSLAIVFVLASASAARAQAVHYEPIRVDSGLSGSYVASSSRGGFGGVVEPKLMIHDNIAVGLHLEGAVMLGGNLGSDNTKVDMGAVAATLVKGEYLLGLGSVRPVAGLGIGMFDIVSQSVEAGPMTAGVDQKAGRYFGVAPTIGIDLGRVRLAATYNMILGADIEVHQNVGGVMQTATYSQSFLMFELGFRFGGAYKPDAPAH